MKMSRDLIQRVLDSRGRLAKNLGVNRGVGKCEEEGGCGVVGFCCTEAVPGRHIYEPSKQMHNRGNGKGGGIAAVGLVPEQLGVSRKVLDECYMLHVALLDPAVRSEMEKEFIEPNFDISASAALQTIDDWRSVPGLEVKPPDVWRYFVRVKPNVLDSFIVENNLQQLGRDEAESEFVSQNSFKLNQKYYASLGEQKAFVMSHGRNIMILKVVGYAEAIVKYYNIGDLRAHVWIAHQRYPTKGRVWHPGGAHPFAAIDMALVHNGDFANYHSVGEYLRQRQIYPQFLTDTEVSALLFDLLDRTYQYPLEYIIEAMAPTTERDFDCLDEEKQKIYRAIQATHIHGSPDGPWFFIIARNILRQNKFQLLGITDTAMLRPQVFAFSDGEVQVGLICSEKQAIDATLLSLSKQDKRICPVADRYWNARGGSHTDGGAFMFDLEKDSSGKMRMQCKDKFGVPVPMPAGDQPCDFSRGISLPSESEEIIQEIISEEIVPDNAFKTFKMICELLPEWTFDECCLACRQIAMQAKDATTTAVAIEVLTLLNDRKYSTGTKKPSHIIHIVRSELERLFKSLPKMKSDRTGDNAYRLVDWESREALREPMGSEKTLVIDAADFMAEGEDCDAALLRNAYMKGWRKFITFGCRGQRFIGCGLGPDTDDVTIDVYGSSGDYLGSGIDGLTIAVHGNAQDQLGQIIKRGKLVIHGDAGQTFMYGAKGGEVYVRGNAAGRPLINSVGRPKAVINGTSLDFLAESFMAGDPLNGGGFVVLNGMTFDDNGKTIPLPDPYPGSNLFSLASGGAIYIRDPHNQCDEQQLNGGQFVSLTGRDWELILPYLEENERLFGIAVEDLLTVDGLRCEPFKVYRKVAPTKSAVSEAIADTDDIVFSEEAAEEVVTGKK
jgi:glutamate synthase domain-containing protein 1/glutamate synthase domain-containing protein 3